MQQVNTNRHRQLPQSETRLGNDLLARLSAPDVELLRPDLDIWQGTGNGILFEAGDPVDYTYFPCGETAASLRVIFGDGEAVETCLIGREGAVGGIVSEGHLPAFTRSIVQIPGTFLRIPTSALDAAKQRSASIRNLFVRYADCLLSQVFQATACNARHSIEQRAARWILAAFKRSEGGPVQLTQEQLANMLGVGRSYVNRVMQAWQNEGLIDWQRGRVTISDVDALEQRQCPCNAAVDAHFGEVLSKVSETVRN